MPYTDATTYRFSVDNAEYLLTFCVTERIPFFRDFHAARSLVHIFSEVENHHFAQFLCWVVMPDHVHALISLGTGVHLSNVVRYIRSAAAGRISAFPGWQKGFHDRRLRRKEDRAAVARYIVMNPVRAGLVRSVKDYPHWDAVYL